MGGRATGRGRRAAASILSVALVIGATGCRPGSDEAAAPTTLPLALDGEPAPASAPVTPVPAPPPPEAAVTTAAPPPATAAPSASASRGPAPPATPAALAAQLQRVEAAVRDPATPATDLPALGLDQQVAYRQLASNPSWRPEVLAALPAGLRPTVVVNADAEVSMASMVKKRPDTFPKWRIVPPKPPAEVLAAHQAAGADIGVPWQILAAINLVETRMGRIRGVSTAGARGPMQFMPATWTQYGAGGDIEDLTDASRAAARLLKRNGVNGNPRGAVWSYNHANAYVDAVLGYAGIMTTDPRAFYGYHGWQVFYRHATGDTLLPEGWSGV
jgi:hypothetical protein